MISHYVIDFGNVTYMSNITRWCNVTPINNIGKTRLANYVILRILVCACTVAHVILSGPFRVWSEITDKHQYRYVQFTFHQCQICVIWIHVVFKFLLWLWNFTGGSVAVLGAKQLKLPVIFWDTVSQLQGFKRSWDSPSVIQCSGLSWKSCRSWSEFWEIQNVYILKKCVKSSWSWPKFTGLGPRDRP